MSCLLGEEIDLEEYEIHAKVLCLDRSENTLDDFRAWDQGSWRKLKQVLLLEGFLRHGCDCLLGTFIQEDKEPIDIYLEGKCGGNHGFMYMEIIDYGM